MNQVIEEIKREKERQDAVILAHYYVNDEVQALADYVGDSYYLAKLATEVPQKTLIFCGVSFMGESAKLLNPDKRVLMPDKEADCPMAHMADPEKVRQIRSCYEDVAVVCYVNSTAELKACSDVCVTSSNALKIVRALPNRRIYFIPDENLGRHIASQVPEKEFIFNEGFCHVHTGIKAEELKRAKEKWPQAEVLVHPECKMEILKEAAYIGSTAGIISYAGASEAKEFIVATEQGVLYELQQRNPDKVFHVAGACQVCADMKRITPEKILQALKTGEAEVKIDRDMAEKANEPLVRMLSLAGK